METVKKLCISVRAHIDVRHVAACIIQALTTTVFWYILLVEKELNGCVLVIMHIFRQM